LTIPGVPFNYNPAQGNLLLDIVVLPGGQRASGNYLARSGDAVGVFSRYHNFGTQSIGYGLVTQFDYVVPEPSAVSLILASFVLLTFLRPLRRLPCRVNT
jgi:hypothetical protein